MAKLVIFIGSKVKLALLVLYLYVASTIRGVLDNGFKFLILAGFILGIVVFFLIFVIYCIRKLFLNLIPYPERSEGSE